MLTVQLKKQINILYNKKEQIQFNKYYKGNMSMQKLYSIKTQSKIIKLIVVEVDIISEDTEIYNLIHKLNDYAHITVDPKPYSPAKMKNIAIAIKNNEKVLLLEENKISNILDLEHATIENVHVKFENIFYI